MQNPQQLSTIDPEILYQYTQRLHIPWNMAQYHTPKFELDPNLQVTKRKWESQKKGVKDNKYVTKRGSYLDYGLKVASGIPSTHAHGAQKEWNVEKLKKLGGKYKIDPKLSKNTYLDQISTDQQKRKIPGICTYSLQKSIKEKDAIVEKLKKKTPIGGEKLCFYMTNEKLSDMSPGPGNYSPHSVSPKFRPNKTDYKFWIDKHKKENVTLTQREKMRPAPGQHNPMNKTLNTFDQLAKQMQKPTKKNTFGLDVRFEYTRQLKKKMSDIGPAPSSYQTMIEWKGKDSPKKTTWSDMVWKGRFNSVYH